MEPEFLVNTVLCRLTDLAMLCWFWGKSLSNAPATSEKCCRKINLVTKSKQELREIPKPMREPLFSQGSNSAVDFTILEHPQMCKVPILQTKPAAKIRC